MSLLIYISFSSIESTNKKEIPNTSATNYTSHLCGNSLHDLTAHPFLTNADQHLSTHGPLPGMLSRESLGKGQVFKKTVGVHQKPV